MATGPCQAGFAGSHYYIYLKGGGESSCGGARENFSRIGSRITPRLDWTGCRAICRQHVCSIVDFELKAASRETWYQC